MLAATHTVTSAAIGAAVESAPLSFGLAFLFHLFADTLLHWNIYIDAHRRPYAWIVVDVLGGLALAFWLMPETFFTAPVLAAVLGGNLPDLWHGGLDLGHKLRTHRQRREPWSPIRKGVFYRFHEGLQNETASPWRGFVWQGVFVALALWMIRSASA